MKTIFLKHRHKVLIALCCLTICLWSCKRPLDLREAFDKVSEIDRFEIEKYESDRYGFPESFEEATVCAHPNSSCREKVINVLSKLPKELLAFEATVDGQVDRFYIASTSLTNNLLFVHIGQGSGDVVLILFSSADLVEARRFLSQLNGYHRSKQHP